MALRINTNVTALTNHKNLVFNDERLSSSLERLSSGLRINRAADDAAGLTVSEKLRTQVRGLNRAIMNTQDGISLIQTAEGAMNEIHAMLQRMRELALQSANDTLTSTDRLEIQKEVQQLKEDINRISYGTEFNTRKLLDGTGTAVISTSDPTNLEGVVTGEVVTFSDYSVVVYPSATQGRGVAQVQRSNIFTKLNGSIADGNTTLQSISNFYDRLGNFLLEEPNTVWVQGDNTNATFVISKDVTLNELARRLQSAMTTDQLGGGLHFDGSTMTMFESGEKNGQLEMVSGKVGRIGRITFTGDEAIVKALGFEEVIQAVDPVYSIAVTNIGPLAGQRKTLTTTIAGNRAAGLIEGVDLMFEPPTNAQVSTKVGYLGISLAQDLQFSIDDNVSVGLGSGVAAISITAGQYAMTQLVSIVNGQISTADPNIRVRARLNDAYAIEFYSTNTGSAAWVSIAGTQYGGIPNVPNPLGVADGRYAGTSGYAGTVTSRNALATYDFTGGNDTAFSIVDRHGNSLSVFLDGNYTAGGINSLVEAINLQINTVNVRAYNNGGLLEIRSLETGVDSNFTINDNGGAVSIFTALQIVGGTTTISGFDGVSARQNFAYDQNSAYYGFPLDDDGLLVADNLSFFIADQDGRGAGVQIPSGAASIGQGFRSLTSIANVVNSIMSANQVRVAAEILSNNTINFYATTPGRRGEVVFAEQSDPQSINTLITVFDIPAKRYDNGRGDYAYTLHIKDAFIQFQIGPNQGHQAKANIIRTDVKALGIMDLDVTNVRVAQQAITLLDKAIQYVSGERAKLGAIENRMNYTMNSLRVGMENMAASESRIRDVDMAREVIEMTRFQILQSSSTAMLAQANQTPQRVLDLLR